MNPPKFLYFDLGKVLLRFDVRVMCRQMGEAAGIDPARVYQVLWEHPLQKDYERGRIGTREFYEAFCRDTGTRPDFHALLRAGSDIFDLDASMVPIVAQLGRAGHRMGILSNTCESHWEHCLRRFRMLGELFEVYALSYQIGAAKPEPAMFEAAANLARAAPGEIFFTDDLAGHVAGARAAGFDAVHFTSARQLVAELRARGVRFNY
jgi:putative hydrolase of the HAD superfamily